MLKTFFTRLNALHDMHCIHTMFTQSHSWPIYPHIAKHYNNSYLAQHTKLKGDLSCKMHFCTSFIHEHVSQGTHQVSENTTLSIFLHTQISKQGAATDLITPPIRRRHHGHCRSKALETLQYICQASRWCCSQRISPCKNRARNC